MTDVNPKPVAKEDLKGKFTRPDNYVLDDEQRERITIARVQLLMNHAFFGNLATRLRIVEASDWCPTAATDGRHFYYNQYFVKELDDLELLFLMAHEVLHCVYDHMGVDVRQDRDPKLFNIAADYNINMTIEDNKIGRVITTVPILLDRKYEGLTSFEIYDKLYENAEKINIDDLLDKVLDEHLDEEGDDGAEGDGQGDKDGKKSSKVKISKEEAKQIKDEVKNAVLQSAQAAGAGNVPGAIKRMIDKLTEPKMNWRELIDVNIQSIFKRDFTFMKPSRRGWHCDAILPSMDNDETIDVVLALDMSGSIGNQQAADMFAEVRGIMEQYTDFRLRVFQFDTAVYGYAEFTPENMDELDDYQIVGGGGTDFDCIFDFLKNEDINPEKLVVFTDGYPWGSWGDDGYCDTLWVIHSHHDKTLEAPFGVTCHYEEAIKDKKAA